MPWQRHEVLRYAQDDRVREATWPQRHLPPRLQGAALVVGGVDAQQRAVAGSAGQDRCRDRGRGLWRAVDGAGAAAQRHRRRGAGARRFRHRRLDAQRRHDLGRHQSRQGAGRQEPDRRGVRAQEGRADGRRRRFAHRAGGHHRPREASSAACTGTAASSAPGRRAHYADLATKVETYNKYANAGARWCRASASASSSPRTITTAACMPRAPAICIPRSTTRACSKPRTAPAPSCAPMSRPSASRRPRRAGAC